MGKIHLLSYNDRLYMGFNDVHGKFLGFLEYVPPTERLLKLKELRQEKKERTRTDGWKQRGVIERTINGLVAQSKEDAQSFFVKKRQELQKKHNISLIPIRI